METYIPLSECKDSCLYRIDARNFSLGVFSEASNGFVGIRVKFGRRYLFTEYHWDTGESFGTVKPIEVVEELPHDIVCEERDDNTALFAWLDRHCGSV